MAEQLFAGGEAKGKRIEPLQAGFERGAREHEQAARDEFHVVSARDTEMSRAEVLARMGALERRAEQSLTSHQVMSLDEMNGVAATHRKTSEEICSVRQMRNLKDIKGKVMDIIQNNASKLRVVKKLKF